MMLSAEALKPALATRRKSSHLPLTALEFCNLILKLENDRSARFGMAAHLHLRRAHERGAEGAVAELRGVFENGGLEVTDHIWYDFMAEC